MSPGQGPMTAFAILLRHWQAGEIAKTRRPCPSLKGWDAGAPQPVPLDRGVKRMGGCLRGICAQARISVSAGGWGYVLCGFLEEPGGAGAEEGQQSGPAEDVNVGHEGGLLD